MNAPVDPNSHAPDVHSKEAVGVVVFPAKPRVSRAKSPLRVQMEALQPGSDLEVDYVNKKTPFSVLIAIKRQQLRKRFIFEKISAGCYRVRIGTSAERSVSLRPEKIKPSAPPEA
jgi:hypothetical protein